MSVLHQIVPNVQLDSQFSKAIDEIVDIRRIHKKRYKKASSAKWNMIDIMCRADKFDEMSITCEQIDCLI